MGSPKTGFPWSIPQMKLMVIPGGNTGRPQPGFFRITGKKYFVSYRSQAINISYSTSGSLVFPDHRQKIFRTLPITGKKYFVLYLRWLGEGNFLVQILCGGSVIGHTTDPAPAPIASKEPEKGKRYFGLQRKPRAPRSLRRTAGAVDFAHARVLAHLLVSPPWPR